MPRCSSPAASWEDVQHRTLLILEEGSETIDNCQHILLWCCVNLLDFYKRLGVADRIQFHPGFHFVEPGGRVSELKPGPCQRLCTWRVLSSGYRS